MTLRASDPCRLLVLSRNAADATEHAQWSRAAPTSPCCWRRAGHVAWVCSSERSLSSLWVAWVLHAIFTGGRGGSELRVTALLFFFSICVVCLKILQHSFAAVCLRLKPMPLMRSHGGLDADRRCQNTSDPNAPRPRAEFKRIKNRKPQRVATTPSMFI